MGGDLAFPGVAGHRTPKTRMMGAYIDRLHTAAATDAQLATAFLRVAALVDSPMALMRPRIALRVLRHGHRTPAGHPHHDTAPIVDSDGRRQEDPAD